VRSDNQQCSLVRHVISTSVISHMYETDRQTDRQTDRETDRRTNRQTDRHCSKKSRSSSNLSIVELGLDVKRFQDLQ